MGQYAGTSCGGEIGGAVISKHRHQGGVCILEDPKRVAAADAIRRVHHQRAKVALGAAQALLRSPEGSVKPADQESHSKKQGEAGERPEIFAWSQICG